MEEADTEEMSEKETLDWTEEVEEAYKEGAETVSEIEEVLL